MAFGQMELQSADDRKTSYEEKTCSIAVLRSSLFCVLRGYIRERQRLDLLKVTVMS